METLKIIVGAPEKSLVAPGLVVQRSETRSKTKVIKSEISPWLESKL